jgi:hypothetical protein
MAVTPPLFKTTLKLFAPLVVLSILFELIVPE